MRPCWCRRHRRLSPTPWRGLTDAALRRFGGPRPGCAKPFNGLRLAEQTLQAMEEADAAPFLPLIGARDRLSLMSSGPRTAAASWPGLSSVCRSR